MIDINVIYKKLSIEYLLIKLKSILFKFDYISSIFEVFVSIFVKLVETSFIIFLSTVSNESILFYYYFQIFLMSKYPIASLISHYQ